MYVQLRDTCAQGAAVALFLLPVLVAIAIGMLRLARRSDSY